jgi:hypothetical protein
MRGDENFKFEIGEWYTLTLHIKLNIPATAANGFARLMVNGEQLAEVQNLQWRGNEDVYIDQWGLSTFYGGNDDTWAPSKDARGRPFTLRCVRGLPPRVL